MPRLGDQHVLSRLELSQFDQSEIRHQRRRVMDAGLSCAEHLRIVHQRGLRQQNLLAIERVLVEIVRREAGNTITHRETIYIITYRQHLAGDLAAQPCRELGVTRCQVLPPKYVVPADADRFHVDKHLARARLWHVALLITQHFGWPELVETDDAGH